MTRRVVPVVISVVLAALLAGCSSDSADLGATSVSTSSGAPPTPSVAAVSTTSSTSTAPSSVVDSSTPAALTCQGPGEPPPAGYDWRAEPPCGHKFAWRSLKERTGGSGKWPVTATTNWTVAWQSNTGASGADALTATTADQWDVGEYRTVLVQGSGE